MTIGIIVWFGLGAIHLNYSWYVRWMVNKCDIIKLWWTTIRFDWTILLLFFLLFCPCFPYLWHLALTSLDVHWKRKAHVAMSYGWCLKHRKYYLLLRPCSLWQYFSKWNWLQKIPKIKYEHIFFKPRIMDHHQVAFLFNLPHKRFSHAHCSLLIAYAIELKLTINPMENVKWDWWSFTKYTHFAMHFLLPSKWLNYFGTKSKWIWTFTFQFRQFQVSIPFDFLYILWINYHFPSINIQYWVWA